MVEGIAIRVRLCERGGEKDREERERGDVERLHGGYRSRCLMYLKRVCCRTYTRRAVSQKTRSDWIIGGLNEWTLARRKGKEGKTGQGRASGPRFEN